MSNNVHGLSNTQVLGQKRVNIASHDHLGIAIAGVRRVSSTTVIWRDNTVSRIAQRRNDMAKLVRRLREAMNEQDSTLGLCGRVAVNVVNCDLVNPRRRSLQSRPLRDPTSVVNLSGAPDRHSEQDYRVGVWMVSE